MRLASIAAALRIFGGRANGSPLRHLLGYLGGGTLRLPVAGDGERAIEDSEPIDESFETGEFGQIDFADMTDLLFPTIAVSMARVTDLRRG